MTRPDELIGHLSDAAQRVVHGEAWHGPSLSEALAEVPDAALHTRLFGLHAPAEIAVHAVAWIEEVTRRLVGHAPRMPARGDWSVTDDLTRAELVSLIHEACAAGVAAIRAFPAERLAEIVGAGDRDAPLGAGVSYAAMIQGVAHHTAYHAGQLMVLARAARQGVSRAAGQ